MTTVIATFLDVPPEGPLTVTEGIEPPADCEIPVGDASSHSGSAPRDATPAERSPARNLR